MRPIEQWVPECVGLDTSAVGTAAIRRVARLQMKDLGLKRSEDYAELLSSSPRHREALLEALVVSETWFFREPEAFTALVRMVGATRRPTSATPFRVLCLPCASGEEPFSAAMALMEAGLPAERFQIEGVDISQQALAQARRGCYGKNSFRGDQLGFRDRFFEAGPWGYRLHPQVRDCVRFSRGNLLDNQWAKNRGPYDYIFCRNLLIYFAGPTRKLALETLTRLLVPGGVLFLGPAEQTLAIEEGYQPVALPLAFACQKPANSAQTPVRPGALRSSASPASEESLEAASAAGATAGPAAALSQSLIPLSWHEWEEAWRLVSSGLVAEAAAVCETLLRRRRPEALGYYLLGLLREAQGDCKAAECYRRALYLEPTHYESLMRLAWLAQREGDHASARKFVRRAERRLAKCA